MKFYNKVRDGRGRPSFRKDNGDPIDSGWTGYDCNTPICVQAQQWVPNNPAGQVVLVNSSNDGTWYQAGCPNVTRYTPTGRARVSDSHLCHVVDWYQGVYSQPWASALNTSLGVVSRTSPSRSIRSNHDNYIQVGDEKWVAGPLVTGEGIYRCYNNGSCTAPDTCECSDGWEGTDCSTPLCRHNNTFGAMVGCLNSGQCGFRDRCTCVRRPSLLHLVHPDTPRRVTGYNGTDCSMAMCAQGFYDRLCRDVPGGVKSVSSGGEGCYRCANGGNCTAPDFCTCPPEWTGFDCRTPVCTKHASLALASELRTVDAAKVAAFELDPCSSGELELWRGFMIGRGNCTKPDTCTCFCRERAWRDGSGKLVKKPYKDTLPLSVPEGYITGTADCLDGWEGVPASPEPTRFYSTCHREIFVPSYIRRNLLLISSVALGSLVVVLVCWVLIRRRMRQKYLQAKAERRRSRRSSEEERSRSAHG